MSELTKAERSTILYVETCEVDAGGLLEGIRMNEEDHIALASLRERGLCESGRILASLLGSEYGKRRTHWARLTEAGWIAAHECRRRCALRKGPLATQVFAEVAERAPAQPVRQSRGK